MYLGTLAVTTPSAASIATVTGLYNSILRKPPDADGLNYWATQLDNGMTVAELANQFTVAWNNVVATVNGLYLSILKKNGDADGLTYWATQLQNGMTVDQLASTLQGYATPAPAATPTPAPAPAPTPGPRIPSWGTPWTPPNLNWGRIYNDGSSMSQTGDNIGYYPYLMQTGWNLDTGGSVTHYFNAYPILSDSQGHFVAYDPSTNKVLAAWSGSEPNASIWETVVPFAAVLTPFAAAISTAGTVAADSVAASSGGFAIPTADELAAAGYDVGGMGITGEGGIGVASSVTEAGAGAAGYGTVGLDTIAADGIDQMQNEVNKLLQQQTIADNGGTILNTNLPTIDLNAAAQPSSLSSINKLVSSIDPKTLLKVAPTLVKAIVGTTKKITGPSGTATITQKLNPTNGIVTTTTRASGASAMRVQQTDLASGQMLSDDMQPAPNGGGLKWIMAGLTALSLLKG